MDKRGNYKNKDSKTGTAPDPTKEEVDRLAKNGPFDLKPDQIEIRVEKPKQTRDHRSIAKVRSNDEYEIYIYLRNLGLFMSSLLLYNYYDNNIVRLSFSSSSSTSLDLFVLPYVAL